MSRFSRKRVMTRYKVREEPELEELTQSDGLMGMNLLFHFY